MVLTATDDELQAALANTRLMFEFTRTYTRKPAQVLIFEAVEQGFKQLVIVRPIRSEFSFSTPAPLFYAFKENYPVDNDAFGVIKCQILEPEDCIKQLDNWLRFEP